MGRKRKPGRPKGSTSKKKQPLEPTLNPKIIGEIIAVGLFILAVILLVGAFNFGGAWSIAIFSNFKKIIGSVTFVMPFILAGVGYGLFFPERYPVNKISISGLGLFMVSFCGIFQIVLKKSGGGLIGQTVEDQVIKWFNTPISFLIFTA